MRVSENIELGNACHVSLGKRSSHQDELFDFWFDLRVKRKQKTEVGERTGCNDRQRYVAMQKLVFQN